MDTKQICAILYFDTVKASQIMSSELKRKLIIFINRIISDLKKKFDIIYANNLGDGYLLIGSSGLEIADAALQIRDGYKNYDWEHDGFPNVLKVRVGLHLGIVLLSKEGRKITNACGHALDFGSRIEPITEHNHVFCTENLYRQLISEKPNTIESDFIGEIELAKGAGKYPLYNIRRKGEQSYVTLERGKIEILKDKSENKKELLKYGLCWEAKRITSVSQGVDFIKLPQNNKPFKSLNFKLISHSSYWRAGIKCEASIQLPNLVTPNSFLIHTGRETNGAYGITCYVNKIMLLNESLKIESDKDIKFAFEYLGDNHICCKIGDFFKFEYKIDPILLKNISLSAWGDGHEYEILFYDIVYC
ncbi:MAG: adenylate/guanylate cyclase domain-containing protein [bacterium]